MRLNRTLLNLLIALGLFTFSAQTFAQTGGGASVKENLDLPYDAIGLEEEDEDAPEVIVFYGQNYEGDGIFYCLDRSSSTRGEPIAKEKREVIRNVQEFTERVEFGITFYDRSLIFFPSNSRPAKADAGQKAAATAWLGSIQSGGGSCFGLGLKKCLDMANQSSAKRNVIIYLGDGCPTCPGDGGDPYVNRILNEVKTSNYKKHSVNAIVVGNVCESFPRQLTQQNNGTMTRI